MQEIFNCWSMCLAMPEEMAGSGLEARDETYYRFPRLSDLICNPGRHGNNILLRIHCVNRPDKPIWGDLSCSSLVLQNIDHPEAAATYDTLDFRCSNVTALSYILKVA